MGRRKPAETTGFLAFSDLGMSLYVPLRQGTLDTPPATTSAIRAVVELADLVVIPVRPSPHDLRSVGATVEIVREAGRRFIFALTMAKGNASLTPQAVSALAQHGLVAPSIMHDRVSYASSMTDGRTVLE